MERADPALIRALRGPQGPKGDPGEGLRIDGVVAQLVDLPTPSNGDSYLVGDDLYVAVDGEWVNAGPVRGPEGPPGRRGVQGPRGEAGDGLHIVGAVASPPELPAPEVADGPYVVGPDLELYIVRSGSWVNAGPLRGPRGRSTAFVSLDVPTGAIEGDVWWDPDGIPTGGDGASSPTVISSNEPSSPSTGLMWVDTSTA